MCSGINVGKFSSVHLGGKVNRVNLLNECLFCIDLEKGDRNLVPLLISALISHSVSIGLYGRYESSV